MKYLESFLDNWILPICFALVSAFLTLRQKYIFDEHKNMLQKINELEREQEVLDTKLSTVLSTQSEIRGDIKHLLSLVTEIRIEQAKND